VSGAISAIISRCAAGRIRQAKGLTESLIRLDITVDPDQIANGSGRAKHGSANRMLNRRQGGSEYERRQKTGLQLRSLLKKSGELERYRWFNVPTPEPGPDEVVVRVEGSPINPSDLGLLIGPADMSAAKASGTKESPVVTAKSA